MTHTDNQVSWPVRAVVDLAAYRANLARMRKFAPRSQQMAIVKADAYGHGMEQVSLAAIEAGAQWLGVAKVAEAYRLRQFLDKSGVARDHFGDTPTSALLRSRMFQSDAAGLPTVQRPRIFAWLYTPSTDLKSTIKAEIDLSVSTLDQLDQVSHAADAAGLRARIHLKVDTGLCRGGATLSEFENLCKLARARERSGLVEVSAICRILRAATNPAPKPRPLPKASWRLSTRPTTLLWLVVCNPNCVTWLLPGRFCGTPRATLTCCEWESRLMA